MGVRTYENILRPTQNPTLAGMDSLIKAANAISLRTEESLKSKVGNRIDFTNAILKNENKIIGEPKVHYSLRKYKSKGSYDIMTDISENVTLVKLMDYLGNVNNDISLVGY